jgi:hypothetical protein
MILKRYAINSVLYCAAAAAVLVSSFSLSLSDSFTVAHSQQSSCVRNEHLSQYVSHEMCCNEHSHNASLNNSQTVVMQSFNGRFSQSSIKAVVSNLNLSLYPFAVDE